MNVGRSVVAGLAATAAMTMLMLAGPMIGMPEMNIGAMLGSFMGIGTALGGLYRPAEVLVPAAA